jgi:hypothetical protein
MKIEERVSASAIVESVRWIEARRYQKSRIETALLTGIQPGCVMRSSISLLFSGCEASQPCKREKERQREGERERSLRSCT